MKYDFTAIEKKWQDRWEEVKPYAAETGSEKPKFYGLIEFPYPSAAGLHVGHPRPFTAMDIVSRKKRMEGYNVLFPIGFDAFGLPTENFAIKNHIHPAIVTKQNIENFTRQLKMLGYGFDWDRVVDTTDPNYYKWTQWIFLQLFNARTYRRCRDAERRDPHVEGQRQPSAHRDAGRPDDQRRRLDDRRQHGQKFRHPIPRQ